jgi:general secretion pathway protein J
MCRTRVVAPARILSHSRLRGFTLLEMLIALVIFATLSVIAYQVLNQVQVSNEVSAKKTARLNEIQKAFVVMDSDLRQIALRPFRHQGNEAQALLLLWQEYLLGSEQGGLLFTRSGWLNPQQQFPRGEVLKVGYRLSHNRLERLWWRYPDTQADSEPVVMPLLTGVSSFSVQFYSEGEWSDRWEMEYRLPQAISVSLTLDDYQEVERTYLIAGGKLDVTGLTGSDDESE